ncbi:MAG: nuclear transport factor 2 family protein [Alphaproteobacteria bacterium]
MADGSTAKTVTRERLAAIGAAFASRDPAAIAACFAPDGVFRNAVGPDPWGRRYEGAEEIAGYFRALFAQTPDVRWEHTAEWVAGDRAVVEWRRTATLPDGTRQDWLGCDLYLFRGEAILLKDTYVKVVR